MLTGWSVDQNPCDRISIAGRVGTDAMAESTITAKGQTTVPADIRALVDAKPGTRLVWSAMPDGTIIVRAKTKSILDMAGMLKAPKGKHVSVDDMNPGADSTGRCRRSTLTSWCATSSRTMQHSSPRPSA